MTGSISEDALRGQQSRIMAAMRAQANPQPSEQLDNITQSLLAQSSGQGNYFDMMKKFGDQQKQAAVAGETGIYNQMKEQVARGDQDATAVDKAITDVAGADPKLYASIADSLHSDPQPIDKNNASSMVMKHAAALGINPLSVQSDKAKIAKLNAEAAKDLKGGDEPSLVKTMKAYQSASPEERAIMDRFGKVYEKNTMMDANGNIVPISGAPAAVTTLANAKESGKQQAQVASAYDKTQQEVLGKEAPKMEIGRKQVSDVVNAMKDSYNTLDSMKSIVNTNNTAGQNLSAAARQSGVGQALGSAVGTKEQSIRNEIKTQLPSLINSIRSATGMSAKAMDSNAELQFYLAMATNPKKDIQSNMRALENIEKMFGSSAPLPSGMKDKLNKADMPLSEANPIIQNQLARGQGQVVDYKEYFK